MNPTAHKSHIRRRQYAHLSLSVTAEAKSATGDCFYRTLRVCAFTHTEVINYVHGYVYGVCGVARERKKVFTPPGVPCTHHPNALPQERDDDRSGMYEVAYWTTKTGAGELFSKLIGQP